MTNEPSHHPSVPIQKILIQFFLTFADSSSSSSMPRLQPFAVGQVFNESLYQQVHVLLFSLIMILFYFYFYLKKTGPRPGRHNSTTAAATTARTEAVAHRLRPLPQDLLHLERARLTPVGRNIIKKRLISYHEECLAIKLQ